MVLEKKMKRSKGMRNRSVKTIILAGGKGTRLASLLKDLPKPMLDIKGKPLLYHIMHNAQRNGFDEFLFKTGYLSEKIEKYFGDGTQFGCKIDYFIEKEPLGTAGGLRYLAKSKDDSVYIILYGDELLNLNLRKMLRFHIEKGSQATLVVHHSGHPEDSDVIMMDEESRIIKTIHKPGSREYGDITNAALYILNPECFSFIPESGMYDFGKDMVPKLISENFRIYGYMTDEYMKDVGTVERHAEVNRDIDSGKVFNKVEAVFLDRDGTINEEVNLLHKVEDFRLIEGAGDAIRILNDKNIPVIVVTNQPVVARNLCDEDTLKEIHDHMEKELEGHGAYVDAIYYCPHHPEKNHPDGNPAYRIECECRKPKIGMLKEAAKRFGLDLRNCMVIGDTTTDILTAKNAGCTSILVKTGYGGKEKKYDAQPDHTFDDLMEAARFIVEYNNQRSHK